MSHIPADSKPSEIILDERKYESEKVIFGERRGSELADEFTRLEVQISTVLLAFIGLFFEHFYNGLAVYKEIYGGGLVGTLQWFYALIVISLVGSLVMGLIHIKRKEWWWSDVHCERIAQLKLWNAATEEVDGLNRARIGIKAIRSARKSDVLRSPCWTWVLQTIFLGVGITLLLVLFLTLIFI